MGVEEELCPAASYRVGTACLTASAVQPLPLTLSRESVVVAVFLSGPKWYLLLLWCSLRMHVPRGKGSALAECQSSEMLYHRGSWRVTLRNGDPRPHKLCIVVLDASKHPCRRFLACRHLTPTHSTPEHTTVLLQVVQC